MNTYWIRITPHPELRKIFRFNIRKRFCFKFQPSHCCLYKSRWLYSWWFPQFQQCWIYTFILTSNQGMYTKIAFNFKFSFMFVKCFTNMIERGMVLFTPELWRIDRLNHLASRIESFSFKVGILTAIQKECVNIHFDVITVWSLRKKELFFEN